MANSRNRLPTKVVTSGNQIDYIFTEQNSGVRDLEYSPTLVIQPAITNLDNPTLNVSGTGVKPLVDKFNVPLTAGALSVDGFYFATYNFTNDNYVVGNTDKPLLACDIIDLFIEEPTEISDCVLWLDFSDVDTMTLVNGNEIASITDKSVNGFVATSTGPVGPGQTTINPLFFPGGFNGVDCAQFNQNKMVIPDDPILNFGTDDFTIVKVFRFRQEFTITWYNIISKNTFFTGAPGYASGPNDWGGLEQDRFNLTNYTPWNGARAFGNDMAWAFTPNETPVWTISERIGSLTRVKNQDGYGNDFDHPSNAVSVDNSSDTLIGAWTGFEEARERLDGELAEVIVFRKALSDEEKCQVEYYIKNKWYSTITDKHASLPIDITAPAGGTVVLTHNLGKYPSVQVKDASGDLASAQSNWLNLNQVQITTSVPLTGTVMFN